MEKSDSGDIFNKKDIWIGKTGQTDL